MGVCAEVIPPPEYLECCVDGGVLEPRSLLVHHIPRDSGDS